MPSSETQINEPKGPEQTSPETGKPDPDQEPRPLEPEPVSPVVRGSRWIDYDTHELLTMISELEDERRWARLREGVWIAILLHLALLSVFTWIPKYIFKVPAVVDQNANKEHKDFTYLDSPPEAFLKTPPKVVLKPVPIKPPVIDKETLEAMNRETPAPTPAPAPQPSAPAPAPPPAPSNNQPTIEAPHPSAVPARPNIAMGSLNPADQLRDAMRNASRNPNTGNMGNLGSGGGLPRHPGAGSGGIQILSDTQGVDFSAWIQYWHRETMRTWDPLIPDEVNAPILKQGQVQIRFKVLPSGRLMEGSMTLEGSSGDTALDRAAWGALVGSDYPPLPKEFHGPYLELRALFMYNIKPE